MLEPIARLSLGRYQGSIKYPDGCRLDELEVLVDDDGNLEIRWLVLPGKPSVIDRESSNAGSTYRVSFEDGSQLHLREQGS